MAVEKTLPIVFIFLLGLVLKWRGLLRKEDVRLITALIFLLVGPATIINALSTMTMETSLLLLPLAAIIVDATLLFLGMLLAPLLGLQGSTRVSFLLSFATLEIGSIGYAFMLAFYGSEGLALIALFDLGNALFFFLVIPLLASRMKHAPTRYRLADALLPVAKNPLLWAYGVGVCFNLLHIQISLLFNLFSALSPALLLLMLLLLAAEFELPSFSGLAPPALAMYTKLACGVTVGLLVALLFGFSGMERIAVVLGSSLPISLLTVAFARTYKLDTPFLAAQLSLALPTAIGLSSLLLLLSH